MKIIITIAMILMLIPLASAIYVKETCINSTHIELYSYFNLDENNTALTYEYNQTHHCTYGCVANTCIEKGQDMSGLLIMLNVFAFIPFIMMFVVKEQKIILAMVATILFLSTTFASFNLEYSTWTQLGLPYITFGLALLSVIYLLAVVFIESKEAITSKKTEPIG